MGRPGDELLGIGLYNLADAAHLLRLPPQKARRWAEGYTFRHSGEQHESRPVVRRQLARVLGEEGRGILTFRDLIELKFVAEFRQHGVSMPMIRRVAAKAAELFGSDHPFATGQFATDGGSIFAILIEDTPSDAKTHVQELDRGQYVIESVIRPFFLNQVDLQDEHVARYWPLRRERCVVLDPRRAFGKPIDDASGVPTFVLYQAAKSGESVKRIAQWYEVSQEAVRDAVEYERGLAA